jgi:hypothetical protein
VRKRPLLAVFFAAMAVAARLPFLVTGKIPFDSDEAVEGLMAMHVLDGDFPAFFWGQAFKGVPEVYASAAAFALFGSSVAILKGVTLACFAMFVGLNFVLLDKMSSRWIATAASLLLICAPPALVFWSLDASAEYVLIMLLGTALLLLVFEETADGAWQTAQKPNLPAIGLIIGIGLWVHQLFVVYLIPLGLILAMRSDRWRRRDAGALNRFAVALGAIAGLYLVLGVVAFLFGGISLQWGPVAISATAPQKMARIAVGIGALAAFVQIGATTSSAQARDAVRRYRSAAAGFLVGYSPVLLYSLLVEPARSPARVANLQQLIAAAPDIFGNIFPILAGFKIATTERLPVPLSAAIPGCLALGAYLWSAPRRIRRDFFALFVIFFPVLYFASGAYLDTQSYRYFVPWYAGLTVAWAMGSLALARMAGERVRQQVRHQVRLKPDTTYAPTYAPTYAAAIVAAIVVVHGWQQVAWYQKLQPDTQSLAAIECLKRNGIRGGYAEYWTAYKLTFLAHEDIIIAPTDGVDRYPRYTEYVGALPAHERVNVGSAACP